MKPRSRVRTTVLLAVALTAITGTALARAHRSSHDYILGSTLLESSIPAATAAAVNQEMCVTGSLSLTGQQASTTLASLQSLEPATGALLAKASYGSITSSGTGLGAILFLSGPNATVYAVFLSGSCRDGSASPLVGARALVDDNGDVLQILAWPVTNAPSTTVPFGATFEKLAIR